MKLPKRTLMSQRNSAYNSPIPHVQTSLIAISIRSANDFLRLSHIESVVVSGGPVGHTNR